MADDANSPKRPRAEPEIIPPARGRGRSNPDQTSPYPSAFTEPGATHRVYVTKIGPLGFALLMLAIAILAAVMLIILVGTFLIWVPVVAVLAVVAAIAGLLRRRRW